MRVLVQSEIHRRTPLQSPRALCLPFVFVLLSIHGSVLRQGAAHDARKMCWQHRVDHFLPPELVSLFFQHASANDMVVRAHARVNFTQGGQKVNTRPAQYLRCSPLFVRDGGAVENDNGWSRSHKISPMLSHDIHEGPCIELYCRRIKDKELNATPVCHKLLP